MLRTIRKRICLTFFIMVFEGVLAFMHTTGCVSTLYGKFGTFSSRWYYNPITATNATTCHWRISAASDEKITLNITDMDIEKSINCTFGYVEVRDGLWTTSPLIAKFCGTGPLESVSSTRNKMSVFYKNKLPNGHRGFIASYEAICGDEIYVEKEFILKSHNSSTNYPPSKKCIWKIIVPEYNQVVINFEKFQIEYQENCLFDYVEIQDGSTVNETFCGDQIPSTIISNSNTLTIKFVTDQSVQKEGFLATIKAEYDECKTSEQQCEQICINTIGSYKCDCYDGYELISDGKSCRIACGGHLNASSGTINSPSFPAKYPPNKTCTWDIVASPEHTVVLNFTHFDIEGKHLINTKKHRCRKDKLQIFSKSYGEDAMKRIGSYCGSVLPDPVLAKSNSLRISFFSDSDIEGTGFSLNYFTIEDKCSTFNGNCHHKCVNTLMGYGKCVCSDGYTLQENGRDCKKGLCNFEISSFSGFISSPNYPSTYPPNSNCTWRFKTTPGHRVQINMINFYTEDSHPYCLEDYVEIYEELFESRRLCGSKQGTIFTTRHNQMYMKFISNQWNQYQGFHIEYSSVCGGSLTANKTEKYIFSHNTYSISNYYNNSSCEWLITAPSELKISVLIEFLDLEDSDDCEFDFIEITDGEESVGKFCGGNKPEEIIYSSNVTVKFQSDDNITGKGFRIMYKAVDLLSTTTTEIVDL